MNPTDRAHPGRCSWPSTPEAERQESPDALSRPSGPPSGSRCRGLHRPLGPGSRSCSSAKASGYRRGRRGPKSSNWQVLAQPRFRWYFAGSVISNFGTWLQNTAQVVLAYQLTHSVFWVGLVTCAQFTSPLLLGPWAACADPPVRELAGADRHPVASPVIAASWPRCNSPARYHALADRGRAGDRARLHVRPAGPVGDRCRPSVHDEQRAQAQASAWPWTRCPIT